MIAVLGMYDMPHAQGANDRLWAAIRAELGTGPDHLTRTGDPWAHWQSPDLVLAQTCGLPYRARLCGQVALVGTPDYGLRDCPPGYYCSRIIRRRDDPRAIQDLAQGGILAVNDALSQSGWAAPVAHLAPLGLRPLRTVLTGAHIASAHAVLEGRADYAAIDAVTYQMWERAQPQVFAGLDVVLRTTPTPGLPLITARTRDPEPIARAFGRAVTALSPQDRDILMLRGLVQIPQADYRALPIPAMP